jgi:hypothetical protein
MKAGDAASKEARHRQAQPRIAALEARACREPRLLFQVSVCRLPARD